MKPKSNILPIILIIGLLIGVVYFTTDYFALSGTPVPVDFSNIEENPHGYSGKFYVGTTNLDGTSATYKIVPKSGPSDAMSFQLGWTESTVRVPLVSPASPIQYKFMNSWVVAYTDWADAPYYKLDLNNRKVIMKSTIKVDPVDGNVITKYLNNDVGPDDTTTITQQFSVKDETGTYRTIYVRYENLNFISGDLAPANAMCVLKQGDATTYQLTDYEEFRRAIEEHNGWNDYVYPECYNNINPGLCSNLDLRVWDGPYTWMMEQDKLPDVTPYRSSTPIITLGTNAKVEFPYGSDTFAPKVKFYVPEELGYMVIVEDVSEFEINPIDTIYGIEGGTEQITVTGTAKGTGDIKLSLGSGAVSGVNWDTAWPKYIEKGDSYTFTGTIQFNTGLDADKYFDARVTSEPVGGFGETTYRDFQIYLTDKDTVDTYDVRVYAVYEDTTDIVTTAELYAGYDMFIGYGDATRKDVPAGSYAIYSDNVTGWYSEFTKAHPKTVNVDKDTTVVITFTEDEPTEGYPTWAYILFGILGVVALLFVVLILKEAGVDITVSHLLILLAIIVFAGLMWYGFGLLERLIEALENFKLFGS